MPESLTATVKQVLKQAQAEARGLNQEFVSTDHLQLALVATTTGQAARILKRLGVDKETIRSSMRSVMAYADEPPTITGDLPLSPKAQRAINAALVLARSGRENAITTRHLLIALLEEQRTPFYRALYESGVDVDGLLSALGDKPADPET